MNLKMKFAAAALALGCSSAQADISVYMGWADMHGFLVNNFDAEKKEKGLYGLKCSLSANLLSTEFPKEATKGSLFDRVSLRGSSQLLRYHGQPEYALAVVTSVTKNWTPIFTQNKYYYPATHAKDMAAFREFVQDCDKKLEQSPK